MRLRLLALNAGGHQLGAPDATVPVPDLEKIIRRLFCQSRPITAPIPLGDGFVWPLFQCRIDLLIDIISAPQVLELLARDLIALPRVRAAVNRVTACTIRKEIPSVHPLGYRLDLVAYLDLAVHVCDRLSHHRDRTLEHARPAHYRIFDHPPDFGMPLTLDVPVFYPTLGPTGFFIRLIEQRLHAVQNLGLSLRLVLLPLLV